MKRLPLALAALCLTSSCLQACRGYRLERPKASDLQLEKVVLYRNGVGFFEQQGRISNGHLKLSVPREHLNDILKSLTVVDSSGQVLSVSMPLDLGAFRNREGLGEGSLHQTLLALRGSPVVLTVDSEGETRTVRGRIMLIEPLPLQPAPEQALPGFRAPRTRPLQDYRISVLYGETISTARLSDLTQISMADDNIVLSLHRVLDSASGASMLQLVDVDIALTKASVRDVSVSYVVEAPVWKPTYRVVIPGDGKSEVLLQGWAVVHNMSGEDWSNVQLSLAAGAPIAFRYDMHRPAHVHRADLSGMSESHQARPMVGDARHDDAAPAMAPTVDLESNKAMDDAMGLELEEADEQASFEKAPARSKKKSSSRGRRESAAIRPETRMRPSMQALSRSAPRSRPASQLAGVTQISLGHRVSVPQGRSSMLAFVNERVQGEAALLFRAGGAGAGYANHPYRVLRFRNETPLVLESGPISLFAGGTFVGEGIADPIGAGAWATIPYAVETDVEVTSDAVDEDSPVRVLKITGGVMEVEQFSKSKRTWRVKGPVKSKARKIYIDQAKTGPRYELVSPSPDSSDVEVFPDFYRISLNIDAGQARASMEVVEKTPSHYSVSIWERRSIDLLEVALSTQGLSSRAKRQLAPIVRLRRELGKIDTTLESFTQQKRDLDHRVQEARRNLEAIRKDRAAAALRKQVTEQMMDLSKQADAAGRRIVELRSERLEKRLELDQILQEINIELVAPSLPKDPAPKAKASEASTPQIEPAIVPQPQKAPKPGKKRR